MTAIKIAKMQNQIMWSFVLLRLTSSLCKRRASNLCLYISRSFCLKEKPQLGQFSAFSLIFFLHSDFNDKPISQEALEAEIAQWNKDQKVTLKIDAEASFQDFVTITDMLSKNEIKNVAIVSMKDKGKSAGKNSQESTPSQSVPTTP